MAHELSSVNGIIEAAFAQVGAWHGLGQVIPGIEGMTSEQAIKAAHLDWLVEFVPTYTCIDPDADFKEFKKSRYFATRRSDNKEVFCTGLTERYEPLHNTEAFQFMDGLSDIGMKYESTFALGAGERVCILARMPEVDEIAKDDIGVRYLLMYTTHDGSGSVEIIPTSVRVVCANTLRMAMGQKDKKSCFKVKHTTNMKDKLDQVAEILKSSNHMFGENLAKSKALAAKRISKVDFNNYLDVLFPIPDTDSKKANTQRTNLVNKITDLYQNHATNNLDSIKGTAWAAFNAVTYKVDNDGNERVTKGTNPSEARFDNIIFGSGAKLKDKAMKTAVKMFL